MNHSVLVIALLKAFPWLPLALRMKQMLRRLKSIHHLSLTSFCSLIFCVSQNLNMLWKHPSALCSCVYLCNFQYFVSMPCTLLSSPPPSPLTSLFKSILTHLPSPDLTIIASKPGPPSPGKVALWPFWAWCSLHGAQSQLPALPLALCECSSVNTGARSILFPVTPITVLGPNQVSHKYVLHEGIKLLDFCTPWLSKCKRVLIVLTR